MKRLLAILIPGYLAYLVFTTSCANPGMPSGGDKDSIAPVVLKTVPAMNARGYQDHQIEITFDEFIIPDEVSTKLVVSPPLAKKPLLKTKSKTLIVDLGEQLKPNTTYSLDFKDAIVDNNEKNPLENFRFSFSNGADFDSLEIGGYVRQAENMEPMPDILVSLHSLDSLSAFRDSLPNYIAKTDEEGFFLITNVAAGNYRLYALQDADNSLTYNQPGEMVAFYDSLVVPQSPIVPEQPADTLAKLPKLGSNPFYLLLFAEDVFDQYLDSYKRERANKCTFYFTEAVTDSFRVELLSPEPAPDWSYLEYNAGRDSLTLWVNDTIISKSDTLKMALNYQVLDSLKNPVVKRDTLELIFSTPVEKEKKKKSSKEVQKVIPFAFRVNAKDGFDVYSSLRIEAPEPLASFDKTKVSLYHQVDTVEEKLAMELLLDSLSLRKFLIHYPWEFEEEYRIEMDSAAAVLYSGQPSNRLSQKFKIQKEGYYGKIILSLSNLPGACVLQLLKNTDKEELLQQISVHKNGDVEFPYLKPEKYKIRLIVDRNANGRWDTGNIAEWRQPERVIYYPKIIKLRSNFEIRESWVLPVDLQYKKELIDDDPELKKDALEKNKKSGSAFR